jgi:tetratricopeptide (TPR) repeat protein
VGPAERVVGWCRRKPGVAGLLAALVLVLLAGSAGVLWQWQRAEQNAVAFRGQRDTARQEKERAEHHLQMIRGRVDRLNRLGRDLLRRPGMYRTGQAVLEEALAFYQEMLPEEGNDPRVRREAAQLFCQVASIHHSLGHAGKAAEAFGRQANLLSSLLKEAPASKTLRIALADSQRWRGNALRDLGQAHAARVAYEEAARLHEGLLREFPDDADQRVALANTLLNTATLLSPRDHAADLESLYRRAVEIDRAAVRAAPDAPGFSAELALALATQGMFFLQTGRGAEAEAAVREALAIHQRVLGGGHLKGYVDRYVARNFVSLGRVLTATGRAPDAEQCYQSAVHLLERLVAELPESALRRSDLARTLAGHADLLRDPGRRREAEAIRRRAIGHYEQLNSDFPEDPHHRRNLVWNYLELVRLLWELGRPGDAAEPFRKAQTLAPQDPGVNNNLAWFLATSPEPRLRDATRAVRLAQKAVRARPEFGDYHNTLGVAHYRNGDDKAAVAELETSMRLRAGGDCYDWFFLALAHGRLGDRARARTWLNRAVAWMDRYRPHDDELRRIRGEAEAMFNPPPSTEVAGACEKCPWRGGVRAFDATIRIVRPGPAPTSDPRGPLSCDGSSPRFVQRPP